MSKVIAFLADGTWNGVGVDGDRGGMREVTNVLKLFNNLEGDNDMESFKLAHDRKDKLKHGRPTGSFAAAGAATQRRRLAQKCLLRPAEWRSTQDYLAMKDASTAPRTNKKVASALRTTPPHQPRLLRVSVSGLA